jgi:hypothetical protein
MTHPFRAWLERHLEDAQKEYERTQALEEKGGAPESDESEELYEKVHQMWGYLAGLEKCLKQFKALE